MRLLLSLLFILLFFKNYGQVIYTDLNPDYILSTSINGTHTKPLDIDNDGTVDFDITRVQNYVLDKVDIQPKNNNKFVCQGGIADTLTSTNLISSASSFCSVASSLIDYNYGNNTGNGYWKNARHKFIGIAFNTATGLKYGWIRMANYSTIASYGYNATTGQPIIAGEGTPNVAEYISASGIGNNTDGRDLRIKFNKALFENSLSEYRILVIPTAKVLGFTIDSAKYVSPTNSFSIAPLNKNIDTTLTQFSKDVYGHPIRSLINYKCIVISYPNLSNSADTLMSSPSNTVMLISPTPTLNRPTVTSTFVSADNYNLNIGFNPPSSETGILHYRLYFVEAADSVIFNLDSANKTPATNYKIITPTGVPQSINYVSTNVTTYNGQSLSKLKNYKAVLMAYTDSINTNYSSLSPASKSFTVYTQVEAIKNIVVEDIADTHSISDIKVSFTKATNETGISEYRGLIVNKLELLSFNLDSAVQSTNYISLSPNGSNQSAVLPANTKDYKGNVVTENDLWYFYVLSVPDNLNADAGALSTKPKYFGYRSPDYFIAGELQGPGVRYYDIPDTSINPHPNQTLNYYLDLDSNGVNDLNITCKLFSGMTGSSSSSAATMLNGWEMSCSGTNSNLLLPHDSLDMTHSDLEWKPGSAYFAYSSSIYVPPPGTYTSGGLWNLNQKYMLMRLTGTDTSYAWIKMTGTSSQTTIFSYGVYKKCSGVLPVTSSSPTGTSCATESVTLNVNGAGSYTWSTGATGPSIVINPDVTTTYTVEGTNLYSCFGTAVVTQSVDACAGIKENTISELKIYPNPASSILQIADEKHELENAESEIRNYLGQLVLKQKFSNSIDISQLSNGIYTLKVRSKDITYYSKFIKE